MARALICCGVVLLLTCATAAQAQTSKYAFPTGIEDVATPANTKGVALTVVYDTTGVGKSVQPSHGGFEITAKNSGLEISKAGATAEPDVYFKDANKDSFYTLFMVDPDAPNGQGAAGNFNYLHWLVTNIPGSKLGTNPKNSIVNTIVPYNGPTPPAGTHRYIFLLYQQSGFDNVPVPVADRANFNFAAYAAAGGMRGPVGAVHFVTTAA